MSSATKTIRQRLEYRQPMGVWFAATQTLFNAVAHFYFAVIYEVQGMGRRHAHLPRQSQGYQQGMCPLPQPCGSL